MNALNAETTGPMNVEMTAEETMIHRKATGYVPPATT